MRINFEKIQSPVKVDRDTITGVLMVGCGIGGVTIKASRSLNGWTPYLTITANNHTLHHTSAMPDEMKAFDLLMTRAFESQMETEDKERNAIKTATCAVLFH